MDLGNKLLLKLLIIIGFIGCKCQNAQSQNQELDCSIASDSTNIRINIIDFSYEEIENAYWLEIRNDEIIKEINLKAPLYIYKQYKEQKSEEYSYNPLVEINSSSTYKFILPNSDIDTVIVSDIIFTPHYENTMLQKRNVCRIKSYKLNGRTIEKGAIYIKRDFLLSSN